MATELQDIQNEFLFFLKAGQPKKLFIVSNLLLLLLFYLLITKITVIHKRKLPILYLS